MKVFRKRDTETGQAGAVATGVSRRTFLQKLGTAGTLLGLGGISVQSLRSLLPNLLYEQPRKFKIGNPAALAEGMTFLEDRRLYVFRQGKSFHAISAACTHLGCTVKYTKLQQAKQIEVGGEKRTVPYEFHCPCHGSKFYDDGTNYSGPAPAPLHWYKLEVSPDDGQLLVDMSTEVEQNFRLTV